MVTVDLPEADPLLERLLEALQHGDTVRLCQNGRPVAELRALPAAPNPLDPKGPLRSLAGYADLQALAQPIADDEPEIGGRLWEP